MIAVIVFTFFFDFIEVKYFLSWHRLYNEQSKNEL